MSKKAIIAGGGKLPAMLIEKFNQIKVDYILIAINNSYDNENYNPKLLIDIGYVGKLIDFLNKNKISEIIFAGSVKRPNFNNLKFDIEGAKLLAKITSSKLIGDDNSLSIIIKYFESKNFKVTSINDVLDNLITSKEIFTINRSDLNQLQDIAIGYELIGKISSFDIGQACIVENGLVLGIEGPEGTDELIKRCTNFRQKQNSAVLIKAKKINQNVKVDLPTIGITTILNIIKAGFAGIAIESEYSLMIDKEKIIEIANRENIFVIGI